ncbi:MAG: hypothetical protein AAF639_04540 [Chloroflexota bacterium]
MHTVTFESEINDGVIKIPVKDLMTLEQYINHSSSPITWSVSLSLKEESNGLENKDDNSFFVSDKGVNTEKKTQNNIHQTDNGTELEIEESQDLSSEDNDDELDYRLRSGKSLVDYAYEAGYDSVIEYVWDYPVKTRNVKPMTREEIYAERIF